MALIHDPKEREQRTAEKRRELLRWLRTEIWTSQSLAGDVMNITTPPAIRKTLAGMERDGLIIKHTVLMDSGRRVPLVGITPHGQGLAFDPATEQPEPRYFESSRVPLSVLDHSLDLQHLRLVGERAGWTGWRYPDREGKWSAGQSRPDAIATTPSGEVVAIECERMIKARKRWEVIIADRLQSIKAGRFARVIYTSPSADLAARLAAIFSSIDSVPVTGTRIRLEERHRAAISFTSYDEFLSAARLPVAIAA